MSDNKPLTPTDKKRAQLYKEMPPQLREVADEFVKKGEVEARASVLIAHDLGTRLREVAEKEGVYGRDAFKQLAAYLNIRGGEHTLVNLKLFAEAFTREAVDAAIARSNRPGFQLTKEHFLVVMRIADDKKRQDVLAKAAANGLSATELLLQVRAKFEGKQEARKGAGRKQKVPTDPFAGLRKGFTQSQKLNNYLQLMEETVFQTLLTVGPDELDDKTLEAVEDFVNELGTVQDTAEKVLKNAKKAEERVSRVLRLRKDKPPKEDKAAKPKADAKRLPAVQRGGVKTPVSAKNPPSKKKAIATVE